VTAQKIDVVVLHCDQGMANLVRIYNAAGNLASIVIVDLGAKAREGYSNRAVDGVMSALDVLAEHFPPRIERIVISHQDYDHWSLLSPLREQILQEYPATTIGGIDYGGTSWKPDARAELKEWNTRFGCAVTPMGSAHSDYKVPGTKGDLFPAIDGVAFRVLAVNTPWTQNELNSTSAVVVVELGNVHAVLPGDATADTAAWINTFVYAKWADGGYGNPTKDCAVIQVPHHGALRTIASNYTSANPKLEVGTKFAGFLAAWNVVASAGYRISYHHPHRTVMMLFGTKATWRAPVHDFVVWEQSKKEWSLEKASTRGIFTTVLSLTDPAKTMNYAYTITSAGEISFWLHDGGQRIEVVDDPVAERHAARPRSESVS
jgi:hypothetical protein